MAGNLLWARLGQAARGGAGGMRLEFSATWSLFGSAVEIELIKPEIFWELSEI